MVFVIIYYMDEVEYCNCVFIMVDGCIEVFDIFCGLKVYFYVDMMDDVF